MGPLDGVLATLPEGARQAILGGMILGGTATAMLAMTGKLIGLSGIFDGAFSKDSGQRWKIVFMSGLTIGSVTAGIIYPAGMDQVGSPALSPVGYVVSGLLVGLGTRLGNGCTSGHGLCGLPRLSRRSLVATLTFLTSGVATASVVSAWGASDGAPESTASSLEAPSLAVRLVALTSAFTGAVVTMLRKAERANWRAHLAGLICGASFGGGLVLSGMVRRSKVIDFLALRRDSWDPSLMFVLGFGVMTTLLGFPLVTRALRAPACRRSSSSGSGAASLGEKFEIPTNVELDFPLVFGSWLFGVGWGAGGLCPGPAFVAGAFGLPGPSLYFLPSMLVGMKLAGPIRKSVALPDPSWVTGGGGTRSAASTTKPKEKEKEKHT